MAPVPIRRGGSPAPASGARTVRPRYPIPRRLIREIVHLATRRGRSLVRLEVSGHIIENFDDIYAISEGEEDIEMNLPPAACGGNAGDLPPPEPPAEENDLKSLNWLQNDNLLQGFRGIQDSDDDDEAPPVNHHLLARVGRNSPLSHCMSSPDSSASSSTTVSLASAPAPAPGPLALQRRTFDKPTYPFAYLIFKAMDSNPDQALRVKDIYAWIIKNFPYYRDAPQGWKNSVRHNLSLNKWFHKVSASHKAGRGCLWSFYPECREILIQQKHLKCDNEVIPRKRVVRRGVERPVRPRRIPAAALGSDGQQPFSPGADEYLAAAGVLAMKYGASAMNQMALRHEAYQRRAHPYAANRDERNTAEALLTLAGCRAEANSRAEANYH